MTAIVVSPIEVVTYQFRKAIGETIKILLTADVNLTDAINLCTVWAYFKKDVTIADNLATFSKSSDIGGIVVYSIPLKQWVLTITPTDTNGLTVNTLLHADVKIKNVAGEIYSSCKIELYLERRASIRIV